MRDIKDKIIRFQMSILCHLQKLKARFVISSKISKINVLENIYPNNIVSIPNQASKKVTPVYTLSIMGITLIKLMNIFFIF